MPYVVKEIFYTLQGEGFGLSEAITDRILSFVQIRSKGHADALAHLDVLGAGNRAEADEENAPQPAAGQSTRRAKSGV